MEFWGGTGTLEEAVAVVKETTRSLPPDAIGKREEESSGFSGRTEIENEQEPILVIVAVFYLCIVAFSDGPVRQALLGGSIYESEDLQERFKKFGRLLLRQLVTPSEVEP